MCEPINMPYMDARNLAILRMRETGMSFYRIADAFGLSHQRARAVYLETMKKEYEREGKEPCTDYTGSWLRRIRGY